MPEKLYKLDLLKNLSRNNEEIIRKLTHVFIEQAPKAVEDIKAAYEVQKFDLVSATAHKIKPTFGYFAVAGTEKDIAMIELLANLEMTSPELETLINRLERITKQVIEEMMLDAELGTFTYAKAAVATN